MNLKPLISIVIPTYNRAHLIGEALESIIIQTYKNWECIIVDDGSVDNTESIVNRYIQKDNRFQIYNRPIERLKVGNAARNYGFELSGGEFIIWYDSDDAMLPEKLEQHLDLFCQNPTISVSVLNSYYCNFEYKNPYRPWRDKLFSEDLLNDFIAQKAGWQTGDGLWKKKDLKFLFNENLQSSQDWEFHIKKIISATNIGFKDICMSHIRHTPESIKNSKSINKVLSDYKSRKSVLDFNKKFNKINKIGYRQILDDLHIYFYFFYSKRNFKLCFLILQDVLFVTYKLKDYKLFFKKFILYYPTKFLKK